MPEVLSVAPFPVNLALERLRLDPDLPLPNLDPLLIGWLIISFLVVSSLARMSLVVLAS